NAGTGKGVVGDGEDVEAGATVEVGELADRQRAVAPRRVGVELAEQRRELRSHLTHSVTCETRFLQAFSVLSPDRSPVATPFCQASTRAGRHDCRGFGGRGPSLLPRDGEGRREEHAADRRGVPVDLGRVVPDLAGRYRRDDLLLAAQR